MKQAIERMKESYKELPANQVDPLVRALLESFGNRMEFLAQLTININNFEAMRELLWKEVNQSIEDLMLFSPETLEREASKKVH